MGTLARRQVGGLPVGFEPDRDGELVKLSTRAYEGLDPEGIVRHALEEGVGARQTLSILAEMGHADVALSDVVEARNIIRAELADEYAVSKAEAKAMILRRSDKALARLFHQLNTGDTRAAKDITSLLTLQTKVYGLDKNEDSMTAKLEDELRRVYSANNVDRAEVPRSTRDEGAIQAARDKYRRHERDDRDEGT